MLKTVCLIIFALAVTGCANLDQMDLKRRAMGYRYYDPCIRCGETWQQLPNWQHEAIIRRNRGEQW